MAQIDFGIVGTGITGQSVARYLRSLGEKFIWVDTRDSVAHADALARDFADQKIHFGAEALTMLAEVKEVVVSPGVSLAEPWIQALQNSGIDVIGDIELFCRRYQGEIVAITGSNAKSTVTELTAAMLRLSGRAVFMGGNIGEPVLSEQAFQSEVAVLELSSFQLERTQSLQAKAATCLNISEDHIDHHGSMTGYIEAKCRVFDGASLALLPSAQNDLLSTYRTFERVQVFGAEHGADWRVLGNEIRTPNDDRLELAGARMKGAHNALNYAAAAALATEIGADLKAIQSIVDSFDGLPHRCEFVANFNGVDYIDDSKGTNPGATVAAINGFANSYEHIYLIAGGDSKGVSMQPLRSAAEQYVDRAFLFGKDADILEIALENISTERVVDLEQAVAKAAASSRSGDLVLLSPACASLDMYKNYGARGEHFKALVQELAHAS